MELNETLASYFTNYYNEVWPCFFDKVPQATLTDPQPFFVKKGGVILSSIGKHYANITSKHLQKRITVSIVRKVCSSTFLFLCFLVFIISNITKLRLPKLLLQSHHYHHKTK
jgi:hypothetical protein